jgi:class 3 adenylate cyclase/dihydrofolate reductase
VRRLILSVFVTLDGVMEAPGLEEHRDGRNAWALQLSDPELEASNVEQFQSTDAILLGRTTYQIWAAFWPTVHDGVFAERMNAIPKYVVSKTLQRLEWNNSRLISGDPWPQIEALKEEPGGDIVVYGSADLVAGLMDHDLIDEYRILLFPIILGGGKRLFREYDDIRHLRLVSSRTFSKGVVQLIYQPESQAPTSEFVETYAWTHEQTDSLHAAQDTERVLATVMFTDIVDSTARAAALGDRPWRRLLDRHDEIARAEVKRWHGQLVKTTGDGVLATFDAPTRALRCAFALKGALDRVGLKIRVAIHTGEVEIRGDDVGGIGVHIAARALQEAGSGQILVTRTVRDLATGTDLVFRQLGPVGLRGIPEQWELFEASGR